MSILNKISFQVFKALRMAKYSINYGRRPWAEIEGVRIPVYMHYGYSVLRFIDNGEYEHCEISIIKKTVASDDIVLELGTGIGFVSAYCAKKIGSEKVFTYEANPKLKPLIEETFSLNSVNPIAIEAMLGADLGVNNFYTQTDNFLASTNVLVDDTNVKMVSVAVLSLNEEIKKLQPSYLIMDIEGGEFEIFKIIDFQSIRKIQFELHPKVLSKDSIDFIFAKLTSNGFVKSTLFNFENNFFYERN